ncbi:OLC1v1025272C1 [Oldenlandia corymbosa var. corymbosa]|uniref:peptidylprolyl isomerase n=1 Tax=Oldenlandia corymbosa var. corymbosa TaxID=529605 RepID=A0AAV1C7D8_OLDCO|nr:OLC1v1025272C1 [Oldenlandia corymbosa var. corymbosa]
MAIAEVARTAPLTTALIPINHRKPPVPNSIYYFSRPLCRNISVNASSESVSRRTATRRAVSFLLAASFSGLTKFLIDPLPCWSEPTTKQGFVELPDSGGVKALDLRIGDGDIPVDGDKVAIHYYGRLAAKQGWRFDSTYDHKDATGEPIPFEFILGSGKVISGIESAVRSMRTGGIRRIIVPPSEGYQSTFQEPIPPNVCDSIGVTHSYFFV